MFSIIFARILIKKKVEKKDYNTVFLMITGIGFVGYSGYLKAEDSSNISDLTLENLIIGIPVTLLSNMCASLLYVLFEKVLKKTNTDPLRFTSFSGTYGIFTNFLVILGATFIPCFNSKMCQSGGSLEDPILAIKEISENSKLKSYFGLYFLVMPCYIYLLMYISKNIGSVYLTVTKNTYCISIWIVSVLLGLEGVKIESFVFEFTGFLFIILGTLVYNGMFLKKSLEESISKIGVPLESLGTISLEKTQNGDLFTHYIDDDLSEIK